MDRWMPLPTGLVLDALRGWTTDKPAPKLVAWSALWEGGKHASMTALSKDLGWSRSALYRLRREVDAFRAVWEGETHPETTLGRGVVDIQPLIEQNRTDLTQNRTDLTRLTRARSLLDTDKQTEQSIKADKPCPRLKECWSALLAEYLRNRPGGRNLKFTKSRRTRLRSRMRDFSQEELVAALRWMMTSADPTAVFLQEGNYNIDTLLRAEKCARYVELSMSASFSRADQVAARYEARLSAHGEPSWK